MAKKELSSLLEIAKEAALEAGKRILEIYNLKDLSVEFKADNSPLTKADKAAHDAIELYLANTNIPILSEEGKSIPYDQRKDWNYLWVIDPLDGTKEFIRRNGEFTVNIALVHSGNPILGVVYTPVQDKLYYAAEDLGASLNDHGQMQPLMSRRSINLSTPGIRVVTSRSHLNDQTQDFLDKLIDPVIVKMGSSLKFMILAEGKADVYPRYAPTMEWDTAAGHAILRILKGDIRDESNNSLQYNKANLLNPYFCAQ